MAAPRKRPTREAGTKRPPLRFGEDVLLWAAWLYYEEGLTQGEIADILGASRPTVNNYLADARASGVVNISIAGPRLRAVTTARALEEHFGLGSCYVIPSERGERSLYDSLGSMAAQALPSYVFSGDVVGISWGRTMLALANATPDSSYSDVTVVQATGGTTAAITYTPEACATRLADRLKANFIPLSAPAIVSSGQARQILETEPVIAEQLAHHTRMNRVFLGVSSLRQNSTIHTSGFFEPGLQSSYAAGVGSILGRIIDAQGDEVDGPLKDRTIGMGLDQLRQVSTRVLVAGGYDKIPAILAAMRGGYVSELITDLDTAEGILRADGVEMDTLRPAKTPKAKSNDDSTEATRSRIKKFINAPDTIVTQAMEGAFAAHPDLIAPIDGSLRAVRSVSEKPAGKVGIVIGGGAGHEPSFIGFAGQGLADAVAVGNIFASPPPDRILTCTQDVDRGAGVLYIYGNYTGDVMNFDMASELARLDGIEVRTVVTTDDIASAPLDSRRTRRGTGGNIFTFKVAGAASARMMPLPEVTRLAQKANDACLTVGVALESCAMPDTMRPSFTIPDDEIEFGVGVHGEPGMTRLPLAPADRIVDRICDKIFDEMHLTTGQRVAVLVNSLGATPQMELFVLNRRLNERLAARGAVVVKTLVGNYCTSLDMVGASITIMALDTELEDLLADPCHGFGWQQTRA
ncbi:bifunctional sugar-binding transcriptional regulator/dihydroxyacetone kinase subunit DhaK [Donghicola tyrosinivorans]|uniref:Dihydroxyacetone kinase-like protein n=1 Tax=Donghicola tyrosinivorans TaxID=1652492 RepID=A0A2T0WBE6_9RHOB|nr:bifunctional sugar-binding transcriptional regulator/dihydroxyacetone kinase subunit DhaK [Donghicola tyrosinivorans]PRY84039.1 dihydroxyacetone kinase-like protein [Donghicola tyrosinivorans]